MSPNLAFDLRAMWMKAPLQVEVLAGPDSSLNVQAAVASPLPSGDGRHTSRVMFKPHLLGDAADVDTSFWDSLPQEHSGLRRRLLEASSGRQMQIQSLGQHTGMKMIDVPQDVNISEVLQALQDHPGLCPCISWSQT